MTTHIDKELLQSTLESRIADLNKGDDHLGHAITQPMAGELATLLRLVNAGEYDVKESDIGVKQQDPIDELADLALHDHKAAVDRIQVVQVQPVLLELRNRATELHDRANQAEKMAVVLAETVQGQIRDKSDGPVEAPAFAPNVYVAPASEHERFYNETGLRDRNGGR